VTMAHRAPVNAASSLAHYELAEELGEGGMATVYRARDLRFGRTVAVKLLHAQFGRDPEIASRFAAEAEIQARLLHPNIVTVYELVVEGETLAMVMEHVPGLALDRWIERRGAMPPALAVEVLQQVLAGVAHAHRLGIVHRDLKPSNVLVREEGGRLLAKVMDFGVAKILGEAKRRTAADAKMGTPRLHVSRTDPEPAGRRPPHRHLRPGGHPLRNDQRHGPVRR